jgi:gliding motility-associated-like protein
MRTPDIRILVFCLLFGMTAAVQSQDLILMVPDQQTVCKPFVDIPVRASRFRGIITMQGGISWDTAILRLDTIVSYGPSSLALRPANFGTTLADQGKLFFSWDDPLIRGVSLPDASDLFIIRFTIRPRINTNTVIMAGGNDVELEFLDSTGRILQVGSRNGSISLGFDLPDFNPFIDSTNHCGTIRNLDAGPGFASYVWHNSETTRNILASKDGKYRVTVRNDLGCVGKDSTYLSLFPIPVASVRLTGDSLLCDGDVHLLSASGGNEYRWFRNGIRLSGRNADTLQIRVSGAYSVEVYSDKGCQAASNGTYDIHLVAKPVLNFTERGVCSEVPVTFFNRSTRTIFGKIDWRWEFGDGNSATDPDSVTHVYRMTGNYRVSLIYRNSLCPLHTDTISRTVILKREKDRRYPDIRTLVDHPTTIAARDSGIIYNWRPSTGLQTATIRKPSVTLRQNQEYVIRVTLGNGCVVFDTLRVTVAGEPGIYVPKAFSPNGDGQNDRLIPFLVGISELRHFRVYNRWGNLIHHSGEPNYIYGWDGTYKGIAQPLDTYTWTAVGLDVKGQLIAARGSTLLIR